MKRLDYLRQEAYKQEFFNILDHEKQDIEIATELIQASFGSIKKFREYSNTLTKSNSSVSRIIKEKYLDLGLFTYLNRVNAVSLERSHQIREDLPSRTSRVSEQLSYLNKTISSNCGIEKNELENELD